MQVILHIGTDKTGSTSIQSALSRNRDWLLKRSVYLPSTGFGRDNGHAALLESLEPAGLEALAGELAAARAAGHRLALLSWEGMVRYGGAQARSLRRALQSHDIGILMYVRDQAEIIQSAHLQWVKMSERARAIGAIAQPVTPGQRVVRSLFLRDPRRNYYRTLRRWQRWLPRATFIVREFDRDRLVDGDIVADLLEVLQVRRDGAFSAGGALVNPSLDVEGAMLIEQWRANLKYRERLPTLIDVTQSVINRDGAQTRYFLDQVAVGVVRRHFRRSNARLAQRFMPASPPPFTRARDCWRRDSLGAIRQRSQALARRVWEVNCVPTLWGGVSGARLPGAVQFYAGWGAAEDWGLWSLGERSAMRFRLPCRSLTDDVSSIRLHAGGRYHAGVSGSRVSVNGRDLGLRDLAAGDDIVLPVGALLPCEVLEIALEHDLSGAEPGPGGDARPLAFALSSLSVTLAR